MVLKDTHVVENFSMEHNRGATTTPSTTALTFTARRGYMLSFTTLLLLGAFFVCTLLAVSFIIYNFGTCKQLTPAAGEEVVCTTIRLRHSTPNPLASLQCQTNGTADDCNGMILGPDGQLHPKLDKDVRLPRSIKPVAYELWLMPNLTVGNFNFEGSVEIEFVIVEDCFNVTMHASGLNISKVILIREMNTDGSNGYRTPPLAIRKQYLIESKEFFVIELYNRLVRNKRYKIGITYNGQIPDSLEGFYRSSYEAANQTRWLASTQFQATYARRAFPCFDEPSLKANFTLHISRPKDMVALSNMPILKSNVHETVSNYVWDHFAESVPMSTSLVAYAIIDFVKISDGYFSVWTRPEARTSASYALSVGPRILKFYEQFFGISFPLPKIDMLALPDFQAGAMENWGLITFRETTLLFEEGVSALPNKLRIATVVGHELAHQWFGNLVTPSWWSDIWLNEGFANYMEYIAVDAIEPNWKMLDQFVVNELQNVFTLDALSTSHKISVEVFNPDEISEIFDRISYAKGATIIRMMSHFLTAEVFRRGVSKYVKEISYASAEQDDLWRFLTKEAISSGLLEDSITVKEIMDTWTLQMGFPVVTIIRNPTSNIITLEQRRFAYVNSTNETNSADLLWWIPITFTTSNELNFNNTRPVTWIPKTKTYEIESYNLSTAEWFIFNVQQTGYYRVNYELNNWRAITNHLMDSRKFNEISVVNRAQLIDDVMNLARSGSLSYDVALNMTRYLVHENEHVPWKTAIFSINFITSLLENQGDFDLLKNYVLKLLDNVYNQLRFENNLHLQEDMLKVLKQNEILNLACHLGHRNCILESIRHFENWMQVPNPDLHNPISPNLRSIVYCTAIQYGTEYEWDFAFERYLKTEVSTEKDLLLSAMGCSREPWMLSRYLKRSIAGENIRKQDLFRVFAGVSGNVVGQPIAFAFLKDNWNKTQACLGSVTANMHILLKFATNDMNSKFRLEELESFVNDHLKDNGRPVQQIVEHVKNNVDWMNRNYKSIVDWLKNEAASS